MKSLMVNENFRMALASVRSSRFRSFLTLLGIIVGVVSVVTIFSLGEGVKRQVVGEAHRLGGDIITIRPGAALPGTSSPLSSIGVSSISGTGALNEHDVDAVKKVQNVDAVVPLSIVSGVPSHEGRSYDGGVIIGTTSKMPQVTGVKVEFGVFFDDDETTRKAAIIGPKVAEQLFQENIPIGKSMKIRDQDFTVRGILEKTETGPLGTEADFNNAIIIPYQTGKILTGNNVNIYEILTKTSAPGLAGTVTNEINNTLRDQHGGQQDFSVTKSGDNVLLANSVVKLITGLTGAVAIVSMFIGGISIMNIMLVSVTERTREIGIRKAVGATNRQIRTQFLMEAVVLSLWGAGIGLICAAAINIVIRVTTNFQPVITWQPVVASVLVAVTVGTIFGTAPAFKASRKDPIEALRTGR